MDHPPDDRSKLAPGVPPAGPVRVLRARWSIKTLRETALARAIIAAGALAAVALWIWLVLGSVLPPGTFRGVLALIRGTALPLLLLIFGLHEAWRAVALWREARRRPPAP